MAVRLSQANVGSNENGAVLMMSLQTRLGDLVRGMGVWTGWRYSLSHGRPWLVAHVTGGCWCCLVSPVSPCRSVDTALKPV